MDLENISEDRSSIMINNEWVKIENSFLSELEFNDGKVLKNLPVEYVKYGKAIYNDKGEIINAFVYLHGSGGSCRSLRHMNGIIGKVIDPEKFFIISLSSLGSPASASPSSTKLANEFPNYNFNDMVNFQLKFLEEKFNIKHLKGIMGNSLGACQAITWACNYPDTIDFLVSLVGTYKLAGHNIISSSLSNRIIKSSPDYMDGAYEKQPFTAVQLAKLSYFTYGLSLEYYRSLDNNDIIASMDEMAEESLDIDANDLVWSNNLAFNYDMEEKLADISAKTLIIAINQDLYFPPELDAIPMSKLIKDSQLIIYDSPLGHVGSHEIEKIEDELYEFFKKFF